MIRFIYGDTLHRFPRLRSSMFRDRAKQFDARLGWDDVHTNANGEEIDVYDALNPLYVIHEQETGLHGGSMRFLPTTAETMLNDHFRHLLEGSDIRHPLIWECSRFCLSETAPPTVSAMLLAAGLELGIACHLSHAVGVFDASMVRFYRRSGWVPEILGTCGEGKSAISAGLWEFSECYRDGISRLSGIEPRKITHWLARDLDGSALEPAPVAMDLAV